MRSSSESKLRNRVARGVLNGIIDVPISKIVAGLFSEQRHTENVHIALPYDDRPETERSRAYRDRPYGQIDYLEEVTVFRSAFDG